MLPITTPAELMETINAFRTSRIILTAWELHIFDHLTGNGKSSAEVAAALGADPRATDRLLNAVTAIQLISKTGAIFTNTPFAEKFLVTTSPACMHSLGHYSSLWHTWDTLTESVFTGTSACKSAEPGINDREEEWLEAFIAAMHARGATQGRELASSLDLSSVQRVLDLGGGSGAFTFAMIEKKSDITGVVFDLPKVVPITEKYIIRSGFSGKVSTLSGDYHLDGFGHGFDLILMSAIIHINNPEENRLLISKAAKALNPGGQLVIMDFIMDDTRTQPFTGALFALNMLVGTKHGDCYTESEITHWMSEAGLSNIKLVTTPSGMQMMIGIIA
jgi:2-polyprenyl-3-methyl-5-hydroxy-6-metoxy-1,4-benzoquinol methylase